MSVRFSRAREVKSPMIYRIFIAGSLTALADGAFGIVQGWIAGVPRPVARFFQGIAFVIMGKRPDHGGVQAVLLGLASHVVVALCWAALFSILMGYSRWVRQLLKSSSGTVLLGIVYGPLIWTAMSLLVITPLVHHLPVFGKSWWIEFVGHIVSAGLPISWTFRKYTWKSLNKGQLPGDALG